ncbi:hypothetical protein DB88DRAFT_43527 [Papiliotrema laurentii]|uniref:Protein CPL1-like domain-containing protein n=1 Tax=Papiliotrema laurentii TaxID=5418 RepID=A0AAD9FX81_PAPLA|nr:hypothetical protein DB88DRAFT_43527 [Papiliotrema laurentii]
MSLSCCPPTKEPPPPFPHCLLLLQACKPICKLRYIGCLPLSSSPTDLQLGDIPNTCGAYPAGSVPICGGCTFTCPTGQKPCGRTCIPLSDACSSGFSRRDQLPFSRWCPAPLTPCALPASAESRGTSFECINTWTDIESCGACMFPVAGQPEGTDCTAIPHTTSIDCIGGSCVVNACEKGFVISSDHSACLPLVQSGLAPSHREKKGSSFRRQERRETSRQKTRDVIHRPEKRRG